MKMAFVGTTTGPASAAASGGVERNAGAGKRDRVDDDDDDDQYDSDIDLCCIKNRRKHESTSFQMGKFIEVSIDHT